MPPVTFRRAVPDDMPAILSLLSDDRLGALREQGPEDPAPYVAAFALIDADPRHFLCVTELDGRVVGTLQLSVIPGLSRGGVLRGQIEAVRVARDCRGAGIGRAMMTWAIDWCRAQGCALVQLTTDRSRTEAHRFYDGLGFAPTHLDYKLQLD